MQAWIALIVMSAVAVLLVAIIIGLKGKEKLATREAETRINKLRQELGIVRQQLPIDLPTGLGNANQLEDDWARMAALHKRRNEQFSFVAVRVTDGTHYGEPLEPSLMRDIAEKLFELTRTEDHSYRLDVDTFAFLLTGCGQQGAEVFVDRVKQKLGGTSFGAKRGTVFVEAIAGAAEWNEGLGSLHGLIQAAIKAAVRDQKETASRRAQFEGSEKVS